MRVAAQLGVLLGSILLGSYARKVQLRGGSGPTNLSNDVIVAMYGLPAVLIVIGIISLLGARPRAKILSTTAILASTFVLVYWFTLNHSGQVLTHLQMIKLWQNGELE